jgi:hypothetical protein
MLNKSVIIPSTLSTADDISTAFHIAVNGLETTLSCPDIGWSFAEAVLERFSFLWTKELETVGYNVNKSAFRKAVWQNDNFGSNQIVEWRRLLENEKVVGITFGNGWGCLYFTS